MPATTNQQFIRLRAPQLCLRKLRRTSGALTAQRFPQLHTHGGRAGAGRSRRRTGSPRAFTGLSRVHVGARPLHSRARLTVLGGRKLSAVLGVVGLSNVPRAREWPARKLVANAPRLNGRFAPSNWPSRFGRVGGSESRLQAVGWFTKPSKSRDLCSAYGARSCAPGAALQATALGRRNGA